MRIKEKDNAVNGIFVSSKNKATSLESENVENNPAIYNWKN